MMRPSVRGLYMLIVGLLAASAAEAALPQTVSRVGGRLGPAAKSQKHAKSAVVSQVVLPQFLSGPEGYRFCVSYERLVGGSLDKGSVSAKVEILRDGGGRTVVSVPKADLRAGRASGCTSSGEALAAGDVLIWTFKFQKMSKLPAGSFAEFAGEVLAPGDPFGTFRLVSSSEDRTVLYSQGANLVFCRTDAGFADLWVRLAAERGSDGENGPHIDIDICNLENGGSFRPHDAENPGCSGSKTWDVFWHDDSADVFVNPPSGASCELSLARAGDALEGSFECPGLRRQGGGAGLDLLGGAFRCAIE